MEVLRDRLDRAVDGLCIQFDAAAYGAVLLGYRELDECGVKAGSGNAAAAAAPAAAGGGAAGGSGGASRARAGTEMIDYAGDGAGGGGAHAAMLEDAFGGTGDVFGSAQAAPRAAAGVGTASLLAEVGGALAAASAVAASGVLSIRGITSADANLAALPLRVQQSLVRAVKTLSKDVVVDLLLREARERADAEAAAAAAAAQSDGEADGDEEAARDEALAKAGTGDGEDEWGAGKRPHAAAGAVAAKEMAAAEYARRRAEMRQRPFADLCSSITADDIPQVRQGVVRLAQLGTEPPPPASSCRR